jgi:hypothetical protein
MAALTAISSAMRSPRANSARRLLTSLAESEPDKAQALTIFHEAALAKRVLPSLRDLRLFAADNGLTPVAPSSRDKALPGVVRDLAAMPLDDVKRTLARLPVDSARDERGLEAWTAVILGRERRPDG